MAEVVTTLTIDADTGGAAKYEQAMDGAAKAAEKVTKSLDALYNSSQAANDNVKAWQSSSEAANKAAVSFHFAGVESLEMTNHLRQAAVVAYALSPAFRELANPVIAASVRATGTALSAMAPAAAAATGAALKGFAPLLATLGRVALPIMVVKDAFDAMNAVTELGAEKIKEFNELANNAGSAGVGNDFFQRQTLGAKELRLETGKATDAIKRFNENTMDKLGGSVFDKRVAELKDAGNFQGNAGVASLAQATSVEEKYKAAVLLITTAMEKGERLAALDLSERFLPPELQARLRANSGFLQQMQDTAENIKPVDIVSNEQISYALELKRRLDDAHETLNDKFKPVQKDLTQLGLNYQESWVGIVEVMAGGVTKANDLYSALKGIPALFAEAGNAPFWDKIAEYGSRPEGLVLRGEPGFENKADPARSALAAGLNNPNAVRQSMLQTTNVSYALRPDLSKPPVGASRDSQANDQLDRAIEQIEKHTARVEADTMAQGLGAQALAEFRAETALTTAAMQAGTKVTQELKDKFQDLAQDAGEAALALEKAKVAANIDFANKTRFLSQEDVAIARELRGIYGNDIPAALASTEAGQIRLNNAFAEARNTVRGFAGDLLSGLMNGKNFMDSLSSAAKNLSTSLANKSLDSLMSGNFVMAGVQAAGSFISSLFGGNSKKKEEEERARQAEIAAQQAALQRTQQYNDRAALAGIDQSTLQGQLAAFDIQANQQRQAEAQQGNRAIVALENALGKERQAIVDKANAAIVKSMNDFLASIKTGANSILSPEDQLKYQQDLFASQFEKAKGGDADALDKITSTASALLDLAKSFYASSDGYTAIYRQVTDSISALAANSSPLSGMASGGLVGQYQTGGMVGNGRYGIDSVLARYASGGSIALAGGEYVTRASSVNATTKRALDYVNRTGSLPPANTGQSDSREVVRVLTEGFNGQTTRLSDKLDAVVDRIKRLEDATRQGANLRRVPGTKMAA